MGGVSHVFPFCENCLCVERKHVFWIGEGYHHCARRTNAPSAPSARTFADMFRTTTFLAVFVALIASAQAAVVLPTATCANYLKKSYCGSVNSLIATAAAGAAACPLASDSLSTSCTWDGEECSYSSASDPTLGSGWKTDEQTACSTKTTEADCLPTSACAWIKYGAADNQAACKATEASLVATLTGTTGATTAMIEYLKYDTISMTCMPLYKDSATCMANPKCTYYPVAESCGASINFLISNLDAAGCGTEATSMATKYGTTVATANAVVASGAAGFSSGAVILSALVAALALVA